MYRSQGPLGHETRRFQPDWGKTRTLRGPPRPRSPIFIGLWFGYTLARVTPMLFVFMFIWSFALFAGVTMVWLLAWAIKRGEFNNLRNGARMIFDEDEPIGKVTDRFPQDRAR